MTRTIKLAVAAAMALGATSAFATNGDTLIGLGAKTRGMAGTGIGMSHGAESALVNPALITSIKKDHEISFGGTIFMPKVKTDGGNGGYEYYDSDADMNMIPEVSLANKVNNMFYWGIGMWGRAGMGVDYREAPTDYTDPTNPANGTMNMVTNLQLMQFGVPLAIVTEGLSFGVTPIVQYGALDINYNSPVDGSVVGAGVAQDFGFGFNVGAAYDFSAIGVKGLTLGAVYKSAIEMEYKGVMSQSGFSDKLEQPAEIGVGASFAFGGSTIAFDYKSIQWGDATGYKDFNWKNQNVYMVGYEFAMDNWAVRAGYNYGENPIQETSLGTTPASMQAGTMMNMFNLVGFPAIVESHFALGGTYAFDDTMSVDLAFDYAPETSQKFDIMTAGGPSTVETKHSQTGVSVQLNYAF